jgi:hypothetical protein
MDLLSLSPRAVLETTDYGVVQNQFQTSLISQ